MSVNVKSYIFAIIIALLISLICIVFVSSGSSSFITNVFCGDI